MGLYVQIRHSYRFSENSAIIITCFTMRSAILNFFRSFRAGRHFGRFTERSTGPHPLPRGFPWTCPRACRDLRCPGRFGRPATGRHRRPVTGAALADILTLGHVRESSRAHDQQIRARSVSAHITSLLFVVDRADEDATLCSHARFRACCPGPLLTPCFASCSSLLIVHMPNAQ